MTNIDLNKYARLLKIPHFRGIYMRDSLPLKIRLNESGIINLDSKEKQGTHWVAYIKEHNTVTYFDSYGNLPPPKELVQYFKSRGSVKIRYNYDVVQKYNSYQCGQYCLKFLYNQYNSNI